jgi:hypothetical protein
VNIILNAGKHTLNDIDKGMTMRNNKMTLRKMNICQSKKNIALLLALFIVLVVSLAASSDVPAAGKGKAYGMLTSIEKDGSVIIDEKGYLVSPSVTVVDYNGESISLSSFLPSHFVYFEYEYTTQGFAIVFIKKVPK